MGRTKKETAAKAEVVPSEGAVSLEGVDETKKAGGRGKRKGKEPTDPGNSPPKRTLRSNSKASLVEPSGETQKKPAAKGKKAVVNGHSDEEEMNNGESNGDANGEAKKALNEDKAPATKKAGADKGAKGRKKPAANGTAEKDEEEKEVETEKETEKSKPVKSGGKKKQAETEKADEPAAEGEEKAQAAKGKKKNEAKKEEEALPPKKTKKEEKPAKSDKTEATEKTEKASKPAAEAKKGKGKAGEVKEVAVEHWNAERVKSILQTFCNPSVAFSINTKAPPRRGTFEITIIRENDEELIWSGIKRGPPRKEKFPTDEQVKELAERIFN